MDPWASLRVRLAAAAGALVLSLNGVAALLWEFVLSRTYSHAAVVLARDSSPEYQRALWSITAAAAAAAGVGWLITQERMHQVRWWRDFWPPVLLAGLVFSGLYYWRFGDAVAMAQAALG